MHLKVAFGHEARAGKDLAAGFLAAAFGGTVLRFAQPLYDIVEYTQTRCNLPRRKDRPLMLDIAARLREQDPDVFVDLLHAELAKLEGQNVFVADVRLPNEFAMLKAAGFVMVKISRPAALRAERPDHETERALAAAAWDVTVANDTTNPKLFCAELLSQLQPRVEWSRFGVRVKHVRETNSLYCDTSEGAFKLLYLIGVAEPFWIRAKLPPTHEMHCENAAA